MHFKSRTCTSRQQRYNFCFLVQQARRSIVAKHNMQPVCAVLFPSTVSSTLTALPKTADHQVIQTCSVSADNVKLCK